MYVCIYIYILHAAIYDYSCSTIVRARRGIYRARRNIRRGRTTDGNFDTRRGASRQSNEFHVREIPLSGGRERERERKKEKKRKKIGGKESCRAPISGNRRLSLVEWNIVNSSRREELFTNFFLFLFFFSFKSRWFELQKWMTRAEAIAGR